MQCFFSYITSVRVYVCVFYISSNVPDYLIWIDRTSWFKYQWEALLINEFDDLDLGMVFPLLFATVCHWQCNSVIIVCYVIQVKNKYCDVGWGFSVPLIFSVSLSFFYSLCLCVFLFFSFFISVCLSPCVSLSVCFSLCVSLSVCFSLSLHLSRDVFIKTIQSHFQLYQTYEHFLLSVCHLFVFEQVPAATAQLSALRMVMQFCSSYL